ncbi:MAG: S46 family peptidase [Chitinophagales bacterium]|nr:S46 family peptidase [Chitinophagales bacterium]
MQKLKLLLISLVLIPFVSKASLPHPMPDEGMWLVSVITDINIKEMKKLGFELTASDIYNIDKPSLKDAVMVFGGFCTGEFVSANGLVFTNHHCGYDAVAGVSSPENNYLDNGFWSKNYSEEIPIEGLYVEMLVRANNITDSIIPFLAGLDNTSRQMKAREIISRITDRETESSGLIVNIEPMFNGNQYFIFYMKEYDDVRLVGVPPASIGNYGADTDNWMWPRHTGDFSIFRVYADANNEPAAYSESNVPYKPKKFLTVDISGVKDGDFTMIMGYPGSTNRYLTSFAMQEIITESNPAQVDVFTAATEAMKVEMDKDVATRLAIAPDYSSLKNALKLYTGQISGMTKVLDAVAYKQNEEKAFEAWVNKQGGEVKEMYGSLLLDLKAAYSDLSVVNKEYYYKIYPVLLSTPGSLSRDLNELATMLADKNISDEDLDETIAIIRSGADETFVNYYPGVDLNKTAAFIKLLNNKLTEDQKPQVVKDILSKTNAVDDNEKIDTWTKNAFANSIIASPEKLNAFLDKPKLKKLNADPLYSFYTGLYESAMSIRPQFVAAKQQISVLNRTYMAAQMQMHPEKAFYPDANFTLRLTYGKVNPYSPRDGIEYHSITYLEGVMEKMDNTDEEFIVPDKLYELYKKKDYGQYADASGRMPVCFLSDNDITGGNSGSPIMNDKGHIIGLAFDGNYEGTPGDYIFDPNMNRTINVDIRYVLFVIEKLGGAKNIIDELIIVK